MLVINAGCWGAKFIDMPQRSIDTSRAVDSLLVRQDYLERRIYKVEKQLDKQQEYARRTNASNMTDIEELKDQLNLMQQLLRETSSNRMRAAEISSSTRTPPSYERGDSTSATPEAADSSDSVSGESLPGEEPDTDSLSVGSMEEPSTGSGSVPLPEQMHRQIYLDFSRMEYQIALDDSKVFLETYPDHPLAEDVIFIRGECLIEQKKYFEALKEFSAILKEYPDGEKVPAALLRMAISYDEIGDRDLAAGVLRRLVRDYPYSEESATAKEKFGDLLQE